MRPLIENGYIYIATPPLYKCTKGNASEYCWNDDQVERFKERYGVTESDKQFKIQRYKGLGEMDPEQLWETTMDPARRVLKRVQFNEETESEIDLTFTILMGDKVEPRREFIEKNARFVKNLDI